jgi:hypothetical protein
MQTESENIFVCAKIWTLISRMNDRGISQFCHTATYSCNFEWYSDTCKQELIVNTICNKKKLVEWMGK